MSALSTLFVIRLCALGSDINEIDKYELHETRYCMMHE
jgi:hypothetical protein